MKTREYQLTDEEARIIEAYRAADNRGKGMILASAAIEMDWMDKVATEQRSKMKVI